MTTNFPVLHHGADILNHKANSAEMVNAYVSASRMNQVAEHLCVAYYSRAEGFRDVFMLPAYILVSELCASLIPITKDDRVKDALQAVADLKEVPQPETPPD